jgi:hypothetical protein
MEAVINKYQGGKIYTIRSPHTDKYYIGSTIETYLSSRLNGHNANYKRFLKGPGKNTASFEILKLGDAYIELLELFSCNSLLELRKREGQLIRQYKDDCVNKNIAGQTIKEYKKVYYENNKEIITKNVKEYNEDKKEQKREYNLKYNKANRDKLKLYYQEYYKNNKQIII